MIHIGPRRVIAVHEFEALAVDDGTGIHVLTERVEVDFRREAKCMKRRSRGVEGIRFLGRTPQRIHTGVHVGRSVADLDGDAIFRD